jgi:hypothetical protein
MAVHWIKNVKSYCTWSEASTAVPVVPVAAVGMGDAMATHYEAKACASNPAASTWLHPLSHRPPLIAAAIGEACLRILYEQVSGAATGSSQPG